jgi:hypothetical protein
VTGGTGARERFEGRQGGEKKEERGKKNEGLMWRRSIV